MPSGLTAHDGFDHLENVGLVYPRAAYRARPLRDVRQDDRLPVDRHPHLDPPLLEGPAAGAAAVVCLLHQLSPLHRTGSGMTAYTAALPPDGPVRYEPVDKTAPVAGKSGHGPGGRRRTILPAWARP